jgi:hypothetical protein
MVSTGDGNDFSEPARRSRPVEKPGKRQTYITKQGVTKQVWEFVPEYIFTGNYKYDVLRYWK